MLSDEIKSTIRDAYGKLSQSVNGFRPRPSQRQMIAEIAKALTRADGAEHPRIIAVEGPTGTGKTLAYLISTIPIAKRLDKKLVIATATIALQEQLIQKDIPLLQKHSGLTFSYEIAKGRGRYLCPSRIEQYVGGDVRQSSFFQTNDHYFELLKKLFVALDQNQWDGDRDRWPEEIADDVWLPLTNDRHGCLNAKCRFFKTCPFFSARARLEDADVIVANHDLVLADLFLGGGVFLPAPEDTIYVFDEAHHLADKAIEHSGHRMRLLSSIGWLESLPAFTKQLKQIIPKDTTITQDIDRINPAADDGKERLSELYQILSHYAPLQNKRSERSPVYQFPSGKIDAALVEPGKNILKAMASLSLQLDKAKEWIAKALSLNLVNTPQAEHATAQIGEHLNRAQSLCETWQAFLSVDDPKQPPNARWIELLAQNNRLDYLLAASPISAANVLSSKLWNRCYGAVLTSATLTALGTFNRFRYKTGIPSEAEIPYLKLTSPFDFTAAASLWVPAMRSDPTDAAAHTREIAELLPKIISDNGGTLVLFSSRQQMQEVAQLLGEEWRDRLLIQNTLPKQVLLEKHKQKIGNGEASIIFGLASFAEGIDLPGELCTHVIIAKLPFSVPDSPVEAAEREFLESQGKNHFLEVALTDASIKLNQAVGRLLRTETDIGVVTLLDKRVISKHYGKALLNSLPPMRRIIEKAPPAGEMQRP